MSNTKIEPLSSERRKQQNRIAQKKFRENTKHRLRALDKLAEFISQELPIDTNKVKDIHSSSSTSKPCQTWENCWNEISTLEAKLPRRSKASSLSSTDQIEVSNDVVSLQMPPWKGSENGIIDTSDQEMMAADPYDRFDHQYEHQMALNTYPPSVDPYNLAFFDSSSCVVSRALSPVAIENNMHETAGTVLSHQEGLISTPQDSLGPGFEGLAQDLSPRGQNTPLHYAAKSDRVIIVQLLIQRGFDPALTNSCGQTPLHVAAENGSIETVRFLIALPQVRGDARDSAGATALHLAAAAGHVEVVSTLLDSGIECTS